MKLSTEILPGEGRPHGSPSPHRGRTPLSAPTNMLMTFPMAWRQLLGNTTGPHRWPSHGVRPAEAGPPPRLGVPGGVSCPRCGVPAGRVLWLLGLARREVHVTFCLRKQRSGSFQWEMEEEEDGGRGRLPS